VDTAHRPLYHFLPPAGWMNDPNGPIQWNGDYHLFYQHNPYASVDADKHWGHAVSADLVHWEHLPVALAPGPAEYDREGIWSGCTVDNDGVPTIIYTGHPAQAQCLATGTDDLISWTKHPGNPVIAGPPPGFHVTGFRDPFVWREADAWYMVVGSGIEGVGGAAFLYRSSDLVAWTYLHPLCVGQAASSGIMWECPSFFPLGDRHALVVSPYGKVTCFIGSYAGRRFTPESQGLVDLGDPYYAPNCLLDDRGRRIMWGWIQERQSTEAQRAAGWAGVMSLPRILSLGEDGQLRQAPAPELRALRRAHHRFEDVRLSSSRPYAVPGVQGDCLEVIARFEPGEAAAVGIGLRCSPDGAEQTTIICDRDAGTLCAERRRSSLRADVDAAQHGGRFELAGDEPLLLHVFLDRSVIEAFANERACLTTRVYPARHDSLGLRLMARGGSPRAVSLDVWEINATEG